MLGQLGVMLCFLEAFLRHVKAILGYFSKAMPSQLCYFSKAILGYFSSYIGLFSL